MRLYIKCSTKHLAHDRHTIILCPIFIMSKTIDPLNSPTDVFDLTCINLFIHPINMYQCPCPKHCESCTINCRPIFSDLMQVKRMTDTKQEPQKRRKKEDFEGSKQDWAFPGVGA